MNTVRRRFAAKPLELLQAAILFLFLFPLFFQLSGSIFNAKDAIFDYQGNLFLLPLPLASAICFIGIALLLRLGSSHYGMGFVFSLFALMMLSTMVTTGGGSAPFELNKFIHLLQFLLPTFAFVLGQLYRKPDSTHLSFEAIAVYVLLIVIPLEVIATIDGGNTLAANLYFFSLYQHYQYLPVLFIGLFLIVAATFYEKSILRSLIIFLAPWMGVYVAQSISINAIVLALFGATILVWVLSKIGKTTYALALILLAGATFFVYQPYVRNTQAYVAKFNSTVEISDPQISANTSGHNATDSSSKGRLSWSDVKIALPMNLRERFEIWEFYINGVIESPKVFLFGHQLRPDRTKYPSAHNYYLDLVYNFGFVSLLPFLYLIFHSIRKMFRIRLRNTITPNFIMLTALVAFFVFIDSSLKVGFTQPYPGMVMFFLWGLLWYPDNIKADML